jgi:hypothetical protein
MTIKGDNTEYYNITNARIFARKRKLMQKLHANNN